MRSALSRARSFARIERSMISIQVFYEGNVQGVGFRWSVGHVSKSFDVTGWVRNLLDGRVEVQVNGEEDEVRALLDGIAQSDLRALIRIRTENKLENPVAARSLAIRHEKSRRCCSSVDET